MQSGDIKWKIATPSARFSSTFTTCSLTKTLCHCNYEVYDVAFLTTKIRRCRSQMFDTLLNKPLFKAVKITVLKFLNLIKKQPTGDVM